MTPGDALAQFVVARLLADAGIVALVGNRIYDNVPKNALLPYLVVDALDMAPETMDCIDGRNYALQINAWSRRNGSLREARQLTDLVTDALHDATGDLDTHALAEMQVALVRVFRDPDNITGHGVVQVEALVERN